MAKKDFKKELSKELMYKKIMPSAAKADAAEILPAETEESVDAPSPSVTAAQNLPAAQIPADSTHPIRATAAGPIPAGTKPAREPASSHVIVNLMEHLVNQRIDDVISKFNCCNCPRCRKDAIALALNKLPPKYVVAVHDQLIDYTQQRAVAEILTALIQAVLTVRSNPRHDTHA